VRNFLAPLAVVYVLGSLLGDWLLIVALCSIPALIGLSMAHAVNRRAKPTAPPQPPGPEYPTQYGQDVDTWR
jgi:hypothetical protein